MQTRSKIVFFLLFFAFCFNPNNSRANFLNFGQNIEKTTNQWDAHWICCPELDSCNSSMSLFRNTFELTNIPDSFIVHYFSLLPSNLYVNGIKSSSFSNGLSNTQLIDIKPFLKIGVNVIAVQLFDWLDHSSTKKQSRISGFLLQCNNLNFSNINTNSKTWKCSIAKGWYPRTYSAKKNPDIFSGNYLATPTDSIDGKIFPWQWNTIDYDQNNWNSPLELPLVTYKEKISSITNQNYLKPQVQNFRINKLISVKNFEPIKEFPLDGSKKLIIPPRRKVSFLLDASIVTVAFPKICISEGKDSKIRLTYSEALFDRRKEKGNRNDVKNKKIIGIKDVFTTDGAENRLFESSALRTFRYIQLDIETGAKPLIINDLTFDKTTFLPEQLSSFVSSSTNYNDIWSICKNTLEACTQQNYWNEAYFDHSINPADTRIQALSTFALSGNTTLMKDAILQFSHSLNKDGLLVNTCPLDSNQLVPTFSLIWIDLVYDYFMLSNDKTLLLNVLPKIDSILNWYRNHIDANGLVTLPKGYNFLDWKNDQYQAIEGESAVIGLHYAYSLNRVAKLYTLLNNNQKAAPLVQLAGLITTNTYNLCYDEKKMLLADNPEKKSFSQHTNIMGILSNAFSQMEYHSVLKKIFEDRLLTPSSFYYKLYLVEAIKKANDDIDIQSFITYFQGMLNQGLSTTSSALNGSRSDCHVRGCVPAWALMNLYCGIETDAPGFARVKINPHLYPLNSVKYTLNTMRGIITVELTLKNENKLDGVIILPPHSEGVLNWKNNSIPLKSGKQKISIRN